MSTKTGGSRERLAPEIVFAESGHLTDVAVTAFADAQPVLPAEAIAHVAACDACAARVAESALASVAIGEALRHQHTVAPAPVQSTSARVAALRPVRPAPRPPRPMPVFAVGAALVLAAAGVAPLLFEAPRWVPRAAVAAVRLSPLLARTAVAAARAGNSSQALVAFALSSIVAAVAFFVLFRLVAKTAPERAALQEGMSHES